MKQGISRRRCLTLFGAGLGSTLLVPHLSACGGKKKQEELSCQNTAGLTQQEIQMRQQLQYTDHSPKPDQLCDNCQFFQPPAQANACGGCQLIKGPIHPKGWCWSWVQKPAS